MTSNSIHIPLLHNYLNLLEPEVTNFIKEYCVLNHSILLETTTKLNVEVIKEQQNCIVNLARLNDIRWINKFIEAVNQKLNMGGNFIVCAETIETRRKKWVNKYHKVAYLLILPIDFIYKRVIPKLPVAKKLYFIFTRGHNRVMSKAEILGRLISCGFHIDNTRQISGRLYICARKVKKPAFDMQVSYGPLFKMRRVGKDKKIIHVYKFRTMYPYSEYLQEYITEQNKLQNSGKIANDYRITSWGKIFRKLWIDELPMLINWVKGDLKLFGVRPLSQAYFDRYPPYLQDLRTQVKPGLVPPYYVDLPESWEQIIQSEERYLNAYFQHPFLTDTKYFFNAFVNIIFKGKRSA